MKALYRTIKHHLLQLPGGLKIKQAYWWLRNSYQSLQTKRELSARYSNTQEIFTDYYHSNTFQSDESVSGPGSTLQHTEKIIPELETLFLSLQAKTILDAPCGDYNWFQHVRRAKEVEYIGGDIVVPLIEKNQKLHGNTNTTFVHINIIEDPLPKADIFLCRDCFIHFSDEHIFLTLHNFLKSTIPYLLTSTYRSTDKNYDYPTGSFRYINLEAPPFSLPSPEQMIKDSIDANEERYLALWKRDAIAKSFSTV